MNSQWGSRNNDRNQEREKMMLSINSDYLPIRLMQPELMLSSLIIEYHSLFRRL
jgi:hypothetical protein